MDDFFSLVIPTEQVGFVKEQHMTDHIVKARNLWVRGNEDAGPK
jgi:hypothetical protein